MWTVAVRPKRGFGSVFVDAVHALTAPEVESMLAQMKEREEKVKPKVSFEVGETVKVADGPFQNQNGIVEEIDPERGKLRVSVTIFGRATPVELEYWQVERG